MNEDFQSPPKHDSLSPGGELKLAILAGLVSMLVIDLPMVAMGNIREENYLLVVVACVFGAAMMARFCCMAIWLAWGQSRLLWRLPIVLTVLTLPQIVNAYLHALPSLRQWIAVQILGMLGTALLAAPRLRGTSRINLRDSDEFRQWQASRRGQFHMVDLFAWTALAAVGMAVVRWLGPNENAAENFPISDTTALLIGGIGMAMTMFTGVPTVLAIWSMLGPHRSVGFRVAIAVGAIWLLLFLFSLAMNLSQPRLDLGPVLAIHFVALLAMAFLLGAPYLARRSGIRIVKHWHKVAWSNEPFAPLAMPPERPTEQNAME